MITSPNNPPHIRPYRATWNPKEYIYTDGSLVTGNPTLGASIVNPRTQTTTHIDIKSQPERHTINRAELAAITLALEANKNDHTLSILTDSAFIITTIRKYAVDPLCYNHHPHKELLQLADDIIRTRDNMGYNTHIGKVKSHTGVIHNDEVDAAARGVVEGQKTPDTIFTDADPPIRGLRTWPQIRRTKIDTTPNMHNLADLHSSLHKLIRIHTPNTTTRHSSIYGQILHDARTTGSDHTIHAYSTTPYRARRDSLEMAWGLHIQRCKRKHSPSLICTKCQSPLTNTHILGGCRYTAKLRIKRHNNTFRLLLEHLQKSNGGQWPILCANLGRKPATDFINLTSDMDTPPHSHHHDIKHSKQEGLQDDK
jgi:ribonuclease HI